MTATDRSMAGSADELVLRLWPAPSAVGQARHAVGEFCRAGQHSAFAEDAELLTSELMTNACRHARGLITLLVLRDGASLVVTVTDDNVPDGPLEKLAQDPERDSGRGLFLVDAMAGSWGTAAHTAGKSVWFRLP